MKEEKIYFQNEGQQIKGILHSPDTPIQSLIIFVHGFTGTKDGPDDIFIRLDKELVSNNFAVLRFNFRFTTEDWSEFHKMSISGEASDLKVIMDDMLEKYENIGLLGESLGATISILSYDEKINCLVFWYPAVFLNETELKNRLETKERLEELEKKGFMTFIDSIGQKFKIGRKFIEERDKVDLIPLAENISCPTLLVHGDTDTRVPLDQSKRLLEVLKGPKKLEIIPDAEHTWWNIDDTARNPEAQKQAIKLTVEWFKKWLK